MILFSTQSGHAICSKLHKSIPDVEIGLLTVKQFADGEIYVRLGTDVQDKVVLLCAHTAPPADNLITTLLTLSALRENGAKKVLLILPYFAYEKQDHIDQPGACLSAKAVADIVTPLCDAVVTVHLHSDTVRTAIGAAHLHELHPLQYMADMIRSLQIAPETAVLVAPDHGATDLVQQLAAHLQITERVVLTKHRPDHDIATVMLDTLDAKKIAGNHIILVDDLLQTGGTILAAVDALRTAHPKTISFVCTHGVFAADCVTKIEKSSLDAVMYTNTIEHDTLHSNKIIQFDITPYLAELIKPLL